MGITSVTGTAETLVEVENTKIQSAIRNCEEREGSSEPAVPRGRLHRMHQSRDGVIER